MKYQFTTRHSHKPEVVHHGEVLSGIEILRLFREYPWDSELYISTQLEESKVYYSPSLGISDTAKQFGEIIFSAVGEAADYQFLVFYIAKGISVESEEVNFHKALSYLKLYLSKNINELVRAIDPTTPNGYPYPKAPKKNTTIIQDQLLTKGELKDYLKWPLAILNFLLIGFFASLAVTGIQADIWEATALFGGIAIFFTIVLIYYSLKT